MSEKAAVREVGAGVPRRVVPIGYISEWSLDRLAKGERASIWSLISHLPPSARPLMVYIEHDDAERIIEADTTPTKAK